MSMQLAQSWSIPITVICSHAIYLAEQLFPVGGYFSVLDVDGFSLIDADLNQAVGLLSQSGNLEKINSFLSYFSSIENVC